MKANRLGERLKVVPWQFVLVLAALAIVVIVILFSVGMLTFGGGSSTATEAPTQPNPFDSTTPQGDSPSSLPEFKIQKNEQGFVRIGALETRLPEFSIQGIEWREENVRFIPAQLDEPLRSLQTRTSIKGRLTLFYQGLVQRVHPDIQWANSVEGSSIYHVWEMTRNSQIIKDFEKQLPQIEGACPLSEDEVYIDDFPVHLEYISQIDGLIKLESLAKCGTRVDKFTVKGAETSGVLVYGRFEGGEKDDFYLAEYRVEDFRSDFTPPGPIPTR